MPVYGIEFYGSTLNLNSNRPTTLHLQKFIAVRAMLNLGYGGYCRENFSELGIMTPLFL